ncbi:MULTISPECIES: type ISP restriction/modification enzyme [Bradyrhizobium]|uniref:type ISP restriction/modification enzyme n=1 Tax=Bradyrhizobium TaxID=374 RepID=UPI000424668B|nr:MULTISPECIES: type ISP restriction/modification enzyme [Bradyrhizobium]MBR1003621.1 hypothetical protein [Bradyrhizobium liaoningense]MCP1738229.1 hypothetical protein [Bradyrhizobium japonicum]MCP1856013.1 hypothetical protein [Bradyrhizobium japonicum]MCP1897172.1 hypothetical protein [Bradyrhizobium japonicum]MCW2330780.1 hypothetical protein [Bradyrhizobium japonicum]
MPTDHRTELGAIKRFDQLVRYLRDPMGWPIGSDDFEELTFDYAPEELGIDARSAAKIQEIKRLRPLAPNQPWGIFFVKFEPKNLPVVALRRILSAVALKKRASANSAERVAWAADDLLFISNYGEGDERQISFAHFSSSQDGHDLPTLKVLGWDNLDTALHLDAVAKELTEHLVWPDRADDVETWRHRWRSAFSLQHREVVTTSKQLSIRLAELARAIRDRIKMALSIETESGPLTKLMEAFQVALVHDLDRESFADMYAQTIAYGLLSARIADPKKKTADDFAGHMRTNPFLRELMETFLKVGGRRGKAGGPGIDFDELGVSGVIGLLDDANMEAVVLDFGDRNPLEDPVIHFYELFLKEYDPEKRMQRGVFYTPRCVVTYIVRSIDQILRTQFGLADGLADITTWGQIAERLKVDVPEGVSVNQAFVQMLDPATGTGTFLVEVIDRIHETMVAKWEGHGRSKGEIDLLWNEYVPHHLLPRLHGYELLMAPYAIAHLKVGLKLYETGYRFGSEERARIYLTNALEPAHELSGKFAFAMPALAHEAQAVGEIKRRQRFTVVLGNPPYSLLSANMEPSHRALIEVYKYANGERIHERGALQMEKNLNDDYVKFIRLSELTVERSNVGVTGLITNHSFLDNPTMRGLRWNLLQFASRVWVNDLHGNSTKQEKPPQGGEDANVFQIKQGVAVSLCARLEAAPKSCQVMHHECWGGRVAKENWLASNDMGGHPWEDLAPSAPHFLFVPQSESLKLEYEAWPSLPDMMPTNGAGYITARDNLVIDFDRRPLIERIEAFSSSRKDDVSLLKEFDVSNKKGWDVKRARAELKRVDIPHRIVKTNYRPFDTRWIFFDSTLVWGRSWPTMQHVVGHPTNLTLLATRLTKDQWDVWPARTVSSHKAMSAYDTNSVFPLYLAGDVESPQRSLTKELRPNFSASFLRQLNDILKEGRLGDRAASYCPTAIDIFNYAYAVFRSPTFRRRYEGFLKIDFPRLPLVSNEQLFVALAGFGEQLVALHLLESPKIAVPITEVVGEGRVEIERPSWSDETVWVDREQTFGFRNVSEAVWQFHVGGYQVCEKWLKDRRGRPLSKKDIDHFQRIVVAIAETIQLTPQIDATIDLYGGWPEAFQSRAPSRVAAAKQNNVQVGE